MVNEPINNEITKAAFSLIKSKLEKSKKNKTTKKETPMTSKKHNLRRNSKKTLEIQSAMEQVQPTYESSILKTKELNSIDLKAFNNMNKADDLTELRKNSIVVRIIVEENDKIVDNIEVVRTKSAPFNRIVKNYKNSYAYEFKNKYTSFIQGEYGNEWSNWPQQDKDLVSSIGQQLSVFKVVLMEDCSDIDLKYLDVKHLVLYKKQYQLLQKQISKASGAAVGFIEEGDLIHDLIITKVENDEGKIALSYRIQEVTETVSDDDLEIISEKVEALQSVEEMFPVIDETEFKTLYADSIEVLDE